MDFASGPRETANSAEALLSRTLLLSHPAGLGHDMGRGHPERPDRLRAIERVLENERFQPLIREQAPFGDRAAIVRVHPEAYFAAIERAAPKEGIVQLDADTAMNAGTWAAVMHGVGGATRAVDEVMKRYLTEHQGIDAWRINAWRDRNPRRFEHLRASFRLADDFQSELIALAGELRGTEDVNAASHV